ncbi:MAG TPA: cell wall hydrolase, partial [Sphingomicrobium sp.]|nr:cell wall hydrolase [Sphingomicrobium sp.]
CGVVYQGADRGSGCQFSFTCDGSLQRVPVPWLWRQSEQIAEEALKGRVFAPVGHATHYHANYVLPYWADSLDKSAQIGRHIFYRLRSSLGDARAFSQHYGGAEPPFREPGPTLVMPQTAETQQLANTLISDGAHGSAPKVEKASTPAASPLVVDSRLGTLLADAGNRSTRSERPRANAQCSSPNDRKQVSALKADDLRASLDATGC